MKTAEEIHERGREAFRRMQDYDPENLTFAVTTQQLLMLEEIAAQLAELNAQLRERAAKGL